MELPKYAGTSDRRNSRLKSEPPTLSNFEKHVTELKLVRCWNSRRMLELPTHVGTPDPQGFGKLAVGLWSCIPDMSGMNTGHVRYDQDSEPSKSVKVRDVGTPDPCRNSRLTSELPTNQPESNNFTTAGQIPNTSGVNTGHVRYCQTSNKSVSSFVSQILKTHMGWLEHL